MKAELRALTISEHSSKKPMGRSGRSTTTALWNSAQKLTLSGEDGTGVIYPSLKFASTIAGSGTIEVSPGTVTLDGAVVAAQTLDFTTGAGGAAPSLTLNDVQDFAATITRFDQHGATDDALVVDTSLWGYQDFVANSGGTGGALMFSNGSAETAVNLTGTYEPNLFHAVVSGSQTTITYG